MLETISQLMVEPEHGMTAQHRRDMEADQVDNCKDRVARILMLRFENNRSTMAL